MLLLVLEVIDNPREILRSEAHHAVPTLPHKGLAVRNSVIDLVRTRPLELANPLADQQRRAGS